MLIALALAAAALLGDCQGALPQVATTLIDGFRHFATESAPTSIFYPRGTNYIRLNGSQGPSGPTLPVYHATFSPRYCNRTAHREALQVMSSVGFNFVRVFVDSGTPSRSDGVNGPFSSPTPLSNTYMENVANFIVDAAALGIYTMVTLETLPQNSYFHTIAGDPPAWAGFPQFNFFVPSFVRAWAEFASLFAQTLRALLAPSGAQTAVFAYSLANEACVDASQPPFSSFTGSVTTADGETYDMSQRDSRQQCVDANTVHWVDTIAAAVRAAHPGPLVTLGMFTFQAVGKAGPNGVLPGPDPRHPVRPAVLSRFSSLSMLDVHVYPTVGLNGSTWTLASDLQSDEWPLVNRTRTAILMGETGAFKSFYHSPAAAAARLAALQVESCAAQMVGWAVWTWDTWEQGGFLWTMVDGALAIARALAPLTRRDPCQP